LWRRELLLAMERGSAHTVPFLTWALARRRKVLSHMRRVIHARHGRILKTDRLRALDDHRTRDTRAGVNTRKHRLEMKTLVTGASVVGRDMMMRGSDLRVGTMTAMRKRMRTDVLCFIRYKVRRGHSRVRMDIVRDTFFVAVLVITFFFDRTGRDDLDFAAHNHLEPFTTDRLLDSRECRTIAPFVEFAPESVRFELEDPELACREETMTARGVNVGDRAIHYGRFRGTANLREVGEKSSKILEACK
jgi:hypothetical protein